jgi:hypothetical protein
VVTFSGGVMGWKGGATKIVEFIDFREEVESGV